LAGPVALAVAHLSDHLVQLRVATMSNRGRRVTAAMARPQLGVTARTIYRDVEALAAAGVPIHAEQAQCGDTSS
jgi:predicted DNA-binding transcriptional regulator YafY